jgi:2,3-diketo-5-methylthio-1-phosphopentane phosphatase
MEKKSDSVVFFDFDNTIARYDVFDDMIERFAKDSRWIEIEERWRKGEIGSKECLEGQLKCTRITKKALDRYLSRIKLDPYFKKLMTLLCAKKIKAVVLSDNFDYILKRILAHNGIRGLKVYSNKMQVIRDKFIPSFPFGNRKCLRCAHCKSKNLLANASQNNIIIYIGDGRSDICPAQKADIIFAKDSLLSFCRSKNIKHIPFRNLKKVYTYFQRSFA